MIKEIRRKGVLRHVDSLVGDEEDSRIVWVPEQRTFVLTWREPCGKKRYAQTLFWSIRGGRAKYYSAMVRLYRYLRRNKLTARPLRELAN